MSCIWRIWLVPWPHTNSSLFEGSTTRRRKHFSSCHVKWHGKLEEFFAQEARELYKYFLVCFAAIIILLKPVVVVGKWHRFICICCGRGGLHRLSRLVLFAYYVKRKKTLRFFIRNTIEIVRMERNFLYFTWISARADFGHVLGNDTWDTDRISFQIKTVCFQINSIRFRVRNINDESSKTF